MYVRTSVRPQSLHIYVRTSLLLALGVRYVDLPRLIANVSRLNIRNHSVVSDVEIRPCIWVMGLLWPFRSQFQTNVLYDYK